jgi:diamine N-acetyltransferase
MNLTIRQATDANAELVATIISRSFVDVAIRFSLTRENCPKHPSKCIPGWVRQDQKRGVQYFIAEEDGAPSGCMALEAVSVELRDRQRLAVVPDRRGRGTGRALVEHAIAHAKATDGSRVSLSIIAKHVELRERYVRLGFRAGATKSFPHLPFAVLFMEVEVGRTANNSVQPTAGRCMASRG